MKIKEAVKCVPVILGYFLLTELGKVIEFWIFMAHQTESDLYEQQWSWITMPESRLFQIPGRHRTAVCCIDSSCVMYVSSWKRLPCGTVEKD